jgi:hypothetical protein
MLGYVLDGDVAGAITNVESNVESQHVSLGMDSPGTLQPSSVLAEVSTARESLHSRAGESSQFRIHHLFMDAQAPAA